MQFLNKNELVLVLWSLIPVLYLLLLRVTKLFVHLVDMLGGGVSFLVIIGFVQRKKAPLKPVNHHGNLSN